ncbi:acyl carrier protein [Aquirufa sp. OSTEICH-129A]
MNVSFDEFKQKFSEAIEDDSILQLGSKSNFKELESWDSFTGMSVISMIDEEFSITINANEMAKINTLEDLYTLLESKSK